MNLDGFFNPKSIAVIGASYEPSKIGHVIMQNFLTSGYRGKLFPINPKKGKLLNHTVFTSIKHIPETIDLAVICVPAAIVPNVLKECGEKKVKGAIIISAGFSEVGNAKLTKKLSGVIKKFPKMRVIGPNCLGVLYMKNGIDTLFLPNYRLERPKIGNISFISQSGALGSAILDWAAMEEYGINKFISYGNAMDLDEADLLKFLSEDKETKVIVIYIEGVRNGKKFFEIAKKVARKKPVIVIKGGITEAGAAATKSHTGSLAGSVEVYKAMFKQTGIIQANSMEEVFDFAKVFDREPQIKGKRIQIITNGGGYGVLTTDAVLQSGLELAKMSEANKAIIRKNCPSYAVIANPIDLTGDADNNRYQIAIEQAISDKNVDAILLILLFQVPTLDSDIIEVVSEMVKRKSKPLLVLTVGGEFASLHKEALEKAGINTFSSPIAAARALKALSEYNQK